MEEFTVIHVLKRQGYSIRAIARITGIDRRTITKGLKEAELQPIVRTNKKISKLERYKQFIINWINKSESRIPSTVILEEIKQYGYVGSLRILQEFLTKEYAKRTKPDQVIRFETAPGYQAQVDWTTVRAGRNAIYAFAITLGYSRASFVWFTDNMSSSTLINCHHRAFAYFGGVPKTILYDNMKTVVEQRNAYGYNLHKFHRELLDLSKTQGFNIKLCQPYRAKTKGKIERFNSYLKSNFYRPLVAKFVDTPIVITVELLNSHILNWLNKANNRIHGTTGKIPNELLSDEVQYLSTYVKPLELTKLTDSKKDKSLSTLPVIAIQQPALTVYDGLVD